MCFFFAFIRPTAGKKNTEMRNVMARCIGGGAPQPLPPPPAPMDGVEGGQRPSRGRAGVPRAPGACPQQAQPAHLQMVMMLASSAFEKLLGLPSVSYGGTVMLH